MHHKPYAIMVITNYCQVFYIIMDERLYKGDISQWKQYLSVKNISRTSRFQVVLGHYYYVGVVHQGVRIFYLLDILYINLFWPWIYLKYCLVDVKQQYVNSQSIGVIIVLYASVYGANLMFLRPFVLFLCLVCLCLIWEIKVVTFINH